MKQALKRSIIIIVIVALAVGAVLVASKLIHNTRDSLYPREYSEYVEKYSEMYGVPKEIIYAIIKVESNFDPNAVSKKGAMGLMQIMPATFDWIAPKLGIEGEHSLLFDPETNIHIAAYYLSYVYKEFAVWETCYAAYNAGHGNVRNWLKDPEISEMGHLKNIPFEETRNYVIKVSEARKMYEELCESDTNNTI